MEETLAARGAEPSTVRRPKGLTYVAQCPEGHGVFLERADLGSLAESESDWHSRTVQDTATLPRITGDMTTPPIASKSAKSWVETLFG